MSIYIEFIKSIKTTFIDSHFLNLNFLVFQLIFFVVQILGIWAETSMLKCFGGFVILQKVKLGGNFLY